MFTIFAGGKIKEPLAQLCQEYLKRLTTYKTHIQEVPHGQWGKIQKKMDHYWIVLDEKGLSMPSSMFATQLQTLILRHKICFLIGEADGHSPCILDKKDALWSLGPMTWPHLWARTMLLEQIYRAQQYEKGHPYSFI